MEARDDADRRLDENAVVGAMQADEMKTEVAAVAVQAAPPTPRRPPLRPCGPHPTS